MMRRQALSATVVAVATLGGLSASAIAQVNLSPVVARVGENNGRTITRFVPTPDGNFVGVGTRRNENGSDILIRKVNREGQTLWERVYEKETRADIGVGIAIGPEGSIYVNGVLLSGDAGIAPIGDLVTLKYDREGVLLWDRIIEEGNENNLNPRPAMVVDAEGRVYVAAQQRNNTVDYLVVKYAPNGEVMWESTLNPGGEDIALDVSVDRAGSVYVTGQSTVGDQADIMTYKLDSNGEPVWDARFDRFSRFDAGAKVLANDSGDVYVTGVSEGLLNENDVVTLKYNADGDRLWMETYNGPGDGSDRGLFLELDRFGAPVVAGTSQGANNRQDFVLIRYNPETGDRTMTSRFRSLTDNDLRLTTFRLDRQGNHYLAGHTTSVTADIPQNLIVKIGANGLPLWSGTYRPENEGSATYSDAAVDPAGNVFAVGVWSRQADRRGLFVRYSPFQSQDVAVGGDDKLRLLTRRSDNGAAQLRLVNPATGAVERINTIPSPEGYTPQAIATAPDNTTYLLWHATNGAVKIWKYNASLSEIVLRETYGPVGGQRPVDISCGLDNLLRLSWRSSNANTRHALSVWTINPQLNVEMRGPLLSPPTATQQVRMSVGRDNRARILWDTTTARNIGKNYLWTLNRVGDALNSSLFFGPFGNQAAQSIAMGFDAKPRLLWRSLPPGPTSARLWRLNPLGTEIEKDFRLSEPLPGAMAQELTASLTTPAQWVLWQYEDGRALLRKVNPTTGAIEAGYLYWVF